MNTLEKLTQLRAECAEQLEVFSKHKKSVENGYTAKITALQDELDILTAKRDEELAGLEEIWENIYFTKLSLDSDYYTEKYNTSREPITTDTLLENANNLLTSLQTI